MSEQSEVLSQAMPVATPAEDDVSAWQRLPRAEQLQRLRALLGSAACADVSPATMSDILRRAQAPAAARRG